jgi:hypothetical protein
MPSVDFLEVQIMSKTNEKPTATKTKSAHKKTASKNSVAVTETNEFGFIARPATKYVAIALMILLVVAIVSVARPFASVVDNPEKIDYALHAEDLRIDRLKVAANGTEDVQDWKYLAVIENGEVTMMVTINAQQYMMLNEGDIITGHLVIMTNGEGVFAFVGDENNCEVICYNRHN